jgi:ankyrin repeat protein
MPAVPPRPSLEFDRKAAKRLLADMRAGDDEARARLVEFHPRYASSPAGIDAVQLADAQLVLAREYGFASWPRWRAFVEDRLLDREAQAAALTQHLCSQQFRRGADLLEADPSLASHDLYTACACGDVDTVAAELQRDPSLATTAGGPNDWAPILYACYSRFLRRDRARRDGIVEVVRRLLAAGADPSSCYFVEQGGDGKLPQTCLFGAAGIANDPDLTRLLLEAGADPWERAQGYAANEALYHACEFKETECLRLLLEAGCDPKEVSYCLSRALDFDNEAAALLFLEHGADAKLNVRHHAGRTHLHKAVVNRRNEATVRALLERGADPNRPDADGMTPYRFAVGLGHPEQAAVLEEFGADPSQVTDQDRAQGAFEPGSGPSAGYMAIVARRGDLDQVKRMLDAGTDVNGNPSMPPLHSACYAGNLEAARLLVDAGADLTHRNSHGGDALGVAIYGSLDCCHAEGGPGMLLPEEIDHGDYPGLVDYLIEAGSPLPDRISGGSDAVQDVLRRHGVPDIEDEHE